MQSHRKYSRRLEIILRGRLHNVLGHTRYLFHTFLEYSTGIQARCITKNYWIWTSSVKNACDGYITHCVPNWYMASDDEVVGRLKGGSETIRRYRHCAAACTEILVVDGVTPVSYTHLDVYKRQILVYLQT